MGRFKNLHIKGLFIDRFTEIFADSLVNAIKNSILPPEKLEKKLTTRMKKLVEGYENTTASLYLKHHKFQLDEFLDTHFNKQRYVAQKNRRSFIPFILYINGCAILLEKATEQIRRKRIDSTLRMTLILYGMVVRRADEIVNNLLTGNIDAAMIIWRSMYENAIVLLTLAAENDNKLADKFYQHSHRNAQRKIASYQKHYRELGFRPLSDKTDQRLKARTQKLTEDHGKAFLEYDYGWADHLFEGKQKASFRELEDRLDLSYMRPFYLICCEHTHASFNSFQRYMVGNKVILPKLLEHEVDSQFFIDPMQFTLCLLHEVNDYMLYEFSTPEEYNVNLLLMRKIFDQLHLSFNSKKKIQAKKK